MTSIRLSKKHGVNPAIPLCFFCNEEKNEIILAGHLKGDVEAPRRAVWDMNPCDKCRALMDQGVILISAKDGQAGNTNPYRTGGWVVVKDDAIKRIFRPETAEVLLRTRVAFLEDRTWDEIGLPRVK